MNHSPRKLDTAEWILIAGNVAGCLSILLCSLAAVWKLAGELPSTPLFFGAPPQPTNPNRNSYWNN